MQNACIAIYTKPMNKPSTILAIATATGMTPSAASICVSKLCKAKYATKVKLAKGDQRLVTVTLTKKGTLMVERMRKPIVSIEEQANNPTQCPS